MGMEFRGGKAGVGLSINVMNERSKSDVWDKTKRKPNELNHKRNNEEIVIQVDKLEFEKIKREVTKEAGWVREHHNQRSALFTPHENCKGADKRK